jgi:hypothetical protein
MSDELTHQSTLAHIGLALCECGHPLAEHAESGWGPNTVCVEKLDDENAGWYGVCPCVRTGDDDV